MRSPLQRYRKGREAGSPKNPAYRVVSDGAMVKPSVAVADLLKGELESRTVKVTLVVPGVSGVPRIVCEAGSKVRPNGMATGCHIRGGSPPAAANVVTG